MLSRHRCLPAVPLRLLARGHAPRTPHSAGLPRLAHAAKWRSGRASFPHRRQKQRRRRPKSSQTHHHHSRIPSSHGQVSLPPTAPAAHRSLVRSLDFPTHQLILNELALNLADHAAAGKLEPAEANGLITGASSSRNKSGAQHLVRVLCSSLSQPPRP